MPVLEWPDCNGVYESHVQIDCHVMQSQVALDDMYDIIPNVLCPYDTVSCDRYLYMS